MLVKVVNDNVHPYKEKFMGKDILIPPHSAIEMDLNEAHLFLGNRPPNIEVDANGQQTPESYKMLRILRPEEWAAAAQVKKFACMACGEDLHTKEKLDAHIADNHTEAMVDEDAKEKVVSKRKGSKAKT